MENVLEKINGAALRFLKPLNSEETYKVIVEEAVKLVGAEYGTILLEQNSELKRVYASWDKLYDVTPHKRANTYKTFVERKTRIMDVSELKMSSWRPSIAYQQLAKLGIKSMIFIPLSYKNESVGVLIINARYKFAVSPKYIKALTVLGSLASLAIRKTQLYTETKKALKTRDLFISMASHELRTPLTAINGYVQLLNTKLAGKNTVISKWVQQLMWETNRMTSLVKELLEINRIRSGELSYNLKEHHLTEIVNHAIDQFKIAYPNQHIKFTNQLAGASDIVIGDFEKLMQVMTNILDNAAKYSSAEKPITVLLKLQSTCLIIRVKDQGKGIDKKDLPRIFEDFYKGKGPHPDGMGLGLYLAKNIIEKHKGYINVRSRLNKGTTVTIKLPSRKQ